jgi:hypothetical protein
MQPWLVVYSDTLEVMSNRSVSSRTVPVRLLLQVAITVSRVLKAYSNRADLNARMPGFSVQMGFGLHVGWAIEGAIGETIMNKA